MNKNIDGRFAEVANAENSIVVGLVGSLTPDNATYADICDMAIFYGIKPVVDTFSYHYITADGANKRGCKQPTNNFTGFLEIHK